MFPVVHTPVLLLVYYMHRLLFCTSITGSCGLWSRRCRGNEAGVEVDNGIVLETEGQFLLFMEAALDCGHRDTPLAVSDSRTVAHSRSLSLIFVLARLTKQSRMLFCNEIEPCSYMNHGVLLVNFTLSLSTCGDALEKS